MHRLYVNLRVTIVQRRKFSHKPYIIYFLVKFFFRFFFFSFGSPVSSPELTRNASICLALNSKRHQKSIFQYSRMPQTNFTLLFLNLFPFNCTICQFFQCLDRLYANILLLSLYSAVGAFLRTHFFGAFSFYKKKLWHISKF